MPYTSTKQVPDQVNTKTAKAKRAYKSALNQALADGKSEATAHKIANSAASGVDTDAKPGKSGWTWKGGSTKGGGDDGGGDKKAPKKSPKKP
jgi:cation transport regulator ChaB